MRSRTGPIPRKTGLAKQSRGLGKVKRTQAKVYQSNSTGLCYACGTSQQIEHSHILSQGRYPKYRNEPLNWLELCHAHHCLWEHNKAGFAQQYPEAFAEKMRRMALVDSQALEFFKMKNPSLFI